jgi:hypothetical protein
VVFATLEQVHVVGPVASCHSQLEQAVACLAGLRLRATACSSCERLEATGPTTCSRVVNARTSRRSCDRPIEDLC